MSRTTEVSTEVIVFIIVIELRECRRTVGDETSGLPLMRLDYYLGSERLPFSSEMSYGVHKIR